MADGFPVAERQVVVADGAATNWMTAQAHFPRATKILDLMHALAYAWSAASAVGDGELYPAWAELIWQGEVRQVIDALAAHQSRLGEPPEGVESSDPRCRVDRALTYYRNNQSRMRYPEYRKLGLPITSSHIESTVKQINGRIKGNRDILAPGQRRRRPPTPRGLPQRQPTPQIIQTGANHYQTQTSAA